MDAGEWYLEVNGNKVGPFTFDQIQGLLEDGEIRAYHQVTSAKTENQWMSVEELIASYGAPPPPPPAEEATRVVKKAPAPAAAKPAPVAAPPPPAELVIETVATVTETLTPAEEEPVFDPTMTKFDLSFHPPPRPELAAGSPGPVEDDGNDPTLTLFNAIQTVRERRSAPISPPAVKDSAARKSLFKMPNLAEVKAAIPEISPRMWWIAVFAGIVLGSMSWGMIRFLKNHGTPPSGTLTQTKTNGPAAFHPSIGTLSKPAEPPTHLSPGSPPVASRPGPGGHPMMRAPAPPPPASRPNEAAPRDDRDVREDYPPTADYSQEGDQTQTQTQVQNQNPNQVPPVNPRAPYPNTNGPPRTAPPQGQNLEQNSNPAGEAPGSNYPGQNDAGAFVPPADPNAVPPERYPPGNPQTPEGQDPNGQQPPANAPGQDSFAQPQAPQLQQPVQ